MKEFDRSELFVVSKVWPNHLKEKDLLNSLEKSLKRLQTDYIDLYLIHWPNPDVPLEETLSAMAKAVDDGLIKYVGVSNFNKRLLEEAVNKSRVPIVCDQVLYNVEEREPEKDGLLNFCQKEGITLVAYSPLNRGVLSVKTKETLEKIAKKYDATVYQIMLAWLISKDNVVAIPKAGNIKHLKENLEALKIKLSKDDLELINGLK
jgi:diketogulonate reductase-like aldo/keto reductase